MKTISSVYLASPLGFSEVGRVFYYEKLIPALKGLGLKIIDPWTLTDLALIIRVENMPFGQNKKDEWANLNGIIGRHNTEGIDAADMVIAVLDGVDVDSGTASEIGYAKGKDKLIEGYRGDFRLSADNIGSTVNLQVEYFIHSSGGSIAINLDELINNIETKYKIVI